MNAIAVIPQPLDRSTHIVMTRSFMPANNAARLDAYRAARGRHRDDNEFTRTYRRGLRLQERICARPSVLAELFPRREAPQVGTDPPATPQGS